MHCSNYRLEILFVVGIIQLLLISSIILEINTVSNQNEVVENMEINNLSSVDDFIHYQQNQFYDPDQFVTVWQTSFDDPIEATGNNQIKLPLVENGIYNFVVEWGDETQDIITIYNQSAVTHSYSSSGTYIVTITGKLEGWNFFTGISNDEEKIMEIRQWGNMTLGEGIGAFKNAKNLFIEANDKPDLSKTTSLSHAFENTEIGLNANFNSWDISRITDLSYIFKGVNTFNRDLSNWDTSNVLNMSGMFSGVTSFNKPLNDWDTSQVIDMSHMFHQAHRFNQPIDTWNTTKVTDMSWMFYVSGSSESAFNQPLNSWDTSAVTDMSYMFSHRVNFNQPLDNWDTSSVTNMEEMFSYATRYNQSIGNWNISNLLNMRNMYIAVTLSSEHYDHMLMEWSQLNLKNNVEFDAGNSKYSNRSKDARELIISNFNWTIRDAGLSVDNEENGTNDSEENNDITNNGEINDEEAPIEVSYIDLMITSIIALVILNMSLRKK